MLTLNTTFWQLNKDLSPPHRVFLGRHLWLEHSNKEIFLWASYLEDPDLAFSLALAISEWCYPDYLGRWYIVLSLPISNTQQLQTCNCSLYRWESIQIYCPFPEIFLAAALVRNQNEHTTTSTRLFSGSRTTPNSLSLGNTEPTFSPAKPGDLKQMSRKEHDNSRSAIWQKSRRAGAGRLEKFRQNSNFCFTLASGNPFSWLVQSAHTTRYLFCQVLWQPFALSRCHRTRICQF